VCALQAPVNGKTAEVRTRASPQVGHSSVDHVARSDRLPKNSVVVGRSNAVPPVRGCLKSGMVRTVTVRLVSFQIADDPPRISLCAFHTALLARGLGQPLV
jgi:hypothetical protein